MQRCAEEICLVELRAGEIGPKRLACARLLWYRLAWRRRAPSSWARSRLAPVSFAWHKSAWHRSAGFHHLDHRPAGLGKEYDSLRLDAAARRLGLTVEVLESNEVRRVITPIPIYSEAERDLFYRALEFTGQKLVAHGVTVVFDATASRRILDLVKARFL
jgi:hypothetical protein